MIDVHSHVLPSMDDGSASVEESLALLTRLKQQGVDTVVATPHFYAHRESPEAFLHRRAQAARKLCQSLPDSAPRLLLGAEVRYYPGIHQTEQLRQLLLEHTPLLLLEMPSRTWDSGMIGELFWLCEDAPYTVVLAHVERCLPNQRAGLWEELLRRGAKFQINADALTHWSTRGRLLRRIQERQVHFIASDCHNLTSRPPRLDKAWQVVQKKLGQEALDWLEGECDRFFSGNEVHTC